MRVWTIRKAKAQMVSKCMKWCSFLLVTKVESIKSVCGVPSQLLAWLQSTEWQLQMPPSTWSNCTCHVPLFEMTNIGSFLTKLNDPLCIIGPGNSRHRYLPRLTKNISAKASRAKAHSNTNQNSLKRGMIQISIKVKMDSGRLLSNTKQLTAGIHKSVNETQKRKTLHKRSSSLSCCYLGCSFVVNLLEAKVIWEKPSSQMRTCLHKIGL